MANPMTEEEIKAKKRARSQYFKILGIVSGCLVVFFLLYRIEAVATTIDRFARILSPVFWGVALAYLLNPILIFFEKLLKKLLYKKIKNEQKLNKVVKTLSIIFTVLFGISLIAALLLMVIPEFLRSVQTFIEIIPDQLNSFLDWINVQMNSNSPFMQNFGKVLQGIIDYFYNWLDTSLESAITSVLSLVSNSIMSVVGFVMDFFLSIVVVIYTLIEKNRLIAQTKKLLFAVFKPERANDILITARHGHKVFGNYLSGKIIDSILVGIVCFILMTIFGIPYTILVSVLVGFTNIIPFFGPFIGGIPSAFIIFLTDARKGVIFIILVFILQQIEGNIIEPRVIGIKTGVSEFWITFSLLLFGGLFGFIGMIVAVPLFAVLYYIAKTIVDRTLIRKNLPVSSESYLKVGTLEDEGFIYLSEKEEAEQKKEEEKLSKKTKKPKRTKKQKSKKHKSDNE